MAFDACDNHKAGINDKKIIKQGYIEKRGIAVLSGWKQRYIVLYNNGSIEYYTDDSKKTLKGTIDISISNLTSKFKNDVWNAHEAVHSNFNNVKYGFDIECKNHTWKFRCENDKTKQDWIDVMRLCIKQKTEQTIKPSKNETGKCTDEYDMCPDIYHCCFELHVNYDEWIITWPLLKLNEKDCTCNDEKNSDENGSKDCDTSDKILYLFDNKKDRDDEKLDKSIRTLHIPADFDDIYEYFPFENKNTGMIEKQFISQYYCILNLSEKERYLLKCKNRVQRQLFIDAVCEKIYYQDKDVFHKTHKVATKNNTEFKFKYTPIYYHIKYDNQPNLTKWFHVPISIYQYNYKFLLSIERNSSFAIGMSDLSSIINFIIKHYFHLTKFKGCTLPELCQTSDATKKIVTKYLNSKDTDDSATVVSEKDQQVISKYGLVVSTGIDPFSLTTTPVLHGIKCNDNKHGDMSDDAKEIDNGNVNKDNNSDNMFKNNECKDGFNCAIYKKVKNDCEYTQHNYKHLAEKNHFGFDYSNKPECQYKSECESFKRVSRINENANNFNCHRFDDLCHLCIYRHPPRIIRNDNIMANYNKLFNFKKKKNDDMNQFVSTNEMKDAEFDYYGMNGLIYELIVNGFEKDLCLTSKDFKNKHYSLLKIVNQKLQSKKHKQYYKNALARYSYNPRVLMLSLLLYTGGDCNYDLCKSQRNGDYEKWKNFDDCLYTAILSLDAVEDYASYFNKNGNIIFHLYSGLNKVQLKNKGKIDLFYFPTYISTSYNKQVSIQFAQNDGMLMQFDENIVLEKQFTFCSLEWISKFPYECEVLIARTKGMDGNHAATINVMDYEMNGSNNNKNHNNNNNNRLQIVNVSQFDSYENDITLLQQYAIESWQEIFLIGKKGKKSALKAYGEYLKKQKLQSVDNRSIDFEKGLNTMYNDKTFKQYCNNVYSRSKKNKNFQLNQMDFIEMQKQSKVMKRLIGGGDLFADGYKQMVNGEIQCM